MYEISFRENEDIIKVKKFNTKQELEDEYTSRKVGNKILLNNEWYECKYFRKVGSEYIIGVREWQS